jgi:restriction system protein
VRELAGVVSAAGATGGIVACSGSYTAEARDFAQRARIRLIDGRALSAMMNLASAPSKHATHSCPRCGNALVPRTARRGPRSGQSFFGCASFPGCRYTREA